MFVCIALILFACLVVAFGGRYNDAEQLYYDADFADLYDSSDDTGRQFKGGEEYKGVEDYARSAGGSDTADAAATAREIYDQADI